MSRLRRGTTALLGVLLGSVGLAGCDFDVYQLPLPGGTDAGSDAIELTVEFRDVLDLVPKSTVKVNDVSVGQVTAVDLDGYTARVTVELRSDTKLPENTTAEIRQTSLLGEKFVSLSAPETGATGELSDGETIPLDRTGRNPEVEEVLGALSLVLNGGGIAQLKTIASELNQALEGREGAAKSVLTQVDTLMSNLDDGKADIVNAIESLDRLAKTARGQQDTIDAALAELPTALESLDRQREDLVTMLQSLNRLGDVGVRVIKATKDATISTVTQLEPVLRQLANSGDSFVKAFHVFLTYPFVDEVVGRDPQVARNLHMGDYTNLSISLDLDLSGGLTPGATPTLLPSPADPGVIVGLVTRCLQSGRLDSQACKDVLKNVEALLKLKAECQKPANRDTVVCKLLNQVPGLPSLPVPGLGDVLGDITGELGLSRPATGGTTATAGRGPTLGQLAEAYDPGLVSLLVPGMVSR
ncbi:MCE family protein [Nocardioides lianchengensis]|uniref:Phospholipid/cholesterol/gamma-HCH transport system substrate-binding protein n=1 Tax=Nocardioides lianchengensis TaxID=1045774 RepID=A0A1G6TYS5_9ACTN|nr:MCE family protein [Nocardioides lianchengensis]NYG11612.1 phospholipid/cholesterol/gamma-HCH transport system substrate-binding protein [Nocardioides lianchengensis]SDD33517.1 phospholipid/cholesterol/gamma-HCH transport system substrate-binding protein [Nocardioides lianchengensis]